MKSVMSKFLIIMFVFLVAFFLLVSWRSVNNFRAQVRTEQTFRKTIAPPKEVQPEQKAILWQQFPERLPYEAGTVIVKFKSLEMKNQFEKSQFQELRKLFPDLVLQPAFTASSEIQPGSRFSEIVTSDAFELTFVITSAQIRERVSQIKTNISKAEDIDPETRLLLNTVEQSKSVFEFVQLNQLNYVTTNDTYYEKMWHLNNIGQSYPASIGRSKSGKSDADIDAAEGWREDRSEGGENMVVAVIDSGVDLKHSDIQENIWVNAGEDLNHNGSIEKDEENDRDDDNNGFVDDFHGYDFGAVDSETGSPNPDNDPTDEFGHGTHVAGLIAALGQNETGTLGIAYNAKIMAVKVFENAYDLVVAEAVLYAASNGASVINMSLGREAADDEPPGIIGDTIAYAKAKNIPSVVAAGNDSMNAVYFHPARLQDVITVAASDSRDERADYSNYGVKIDVGTPGTEVLSLRADAYQWIGIYRKNYLVMSGTSMASPITAGVVTLIRAAHPDFSVEQIRQVLRTSTDDLGDTGFDEYFGYGRTNLEKALAVDSIPVASLSNLSFLQTEVENNALTIEGSVYGENFDRWDLTYTRVQTQNWEEITSGAKAEENLKYVWNVKDVPRGLYYLRLRGIDKNGREALDIRKIEVE